MTLTVSSSCRRHDVDIVIALYKRLDQLLERLYSVYFHKSLCSALSVASLSCCVKRRKMPKKNASRESGSELSLPKMKTRSVGLTDEMWDEVSLLAYGHDSVPGMIRECLRRGILQLRRERAELKLLEAIAESRKQSLELSISVAEDLGEEADED
jgi:hypothetical protein